MRKKMIDIDELLRSTKDTSIDQKQQEFIKIEIDLLLDNKELVIQAN